MVLDGQDAATSSHNQPLMYIKCLVPSSHWIECLMGKNVENVPCVDNLNKKHVLQKSWFNQYLSTQSLSHVNVRGVRRRLNDT